MSSVPLPAGVLAPLISPLTDALEPDVEAVDRLVDSLVAHGIGFFLLGTTGEGPSLEPAARRTIVARVVERAAGRVPVYAGVSETRVRASIEQAEAWANAGVDGVFAHLPPCIPLSEREIEAYYTTLAEGSPVPLVLYNIPQITGMTLPLPAIERLSRHPNIAGVKDSERDPARLDDSLDLWAERDDFSYLVGWAARSAYGLARGARGIVPASANLVPGAYAAMLSATGRGDLAEAERLQRLTDEVSQCYQVHRGLSRQLAALKYLLHARGLCAPHTMPPIQPLAEAEGAGLLSALSSVEAAHAVQPD